MVKDFDKNGHKDRYYDEGNGKSRKYVKDQVPGQNQGKANNNHPSKYMDQGGFWHCEESTTGEKWGNRQQPSDQDGHKDRYYDEANGKDLVPGQNQGKANNQYPDMRPSKYMDQGGFWHCEKSTAGEKWGNPGKILSKYTATSDFRVLRQAHLEEKFQKEHFKGAEQRVQRRKPNPTRFADNQIRSINQTLMSGMVNVHEVTATDPLVSTPRNKMGTVPTSDTVYSTQLISSATIKPKDSDSENTPIQNNLSPDDDSSASTTRKNSSSPISDSENTPIQKSSPQSSTNGDSSASTTRVKSYTPCLSELENSVHYDCRIDKDSEDLWRPELAGKISMVDCPREVIGAVLKHLGSSYNTTDMDAEDSGSISKEAVLKSFTELQKQVQLFDSMNYLKSFSVGNVWVVVGWSSYVILTAKRMFNVAVVVPNLGDTMHHKISDR